MTEDKHNCEDPNCDDERNHAFNMAQPTPEMALTILMGMLLEKVDELVQLKSQIDKTINALREIEELSQRGDEDASEE